MKRRGSKHRPIYQDAPEWAGRPPQPDELNLLLIVISFGSHARVARGAEMDNLLDDLEGQRAMALEVYVGSEN